MSTQIEKPTNLIQTIEKAAGILDALAQHPKGMSLGELAATAGLPKGTAHRLLSSLGYFNFVRQDAETRNYNLGFKLVELGYSLLDQIDLRKEAEPFLQNLAQSTNETVYLVVLDGTEVVYLERMETNDPTVVLRATSKVGQRNAAHSCAVGKTLLAYLPEPEYVELVKGMSFVRRTENTITDPIQLKDHLVGIRARGYAVDDEESELGIRCVAAPVWNERGQTIAAISASGPSIRVTRERIQNELKSAVTATALQISRKLGYRGE